MGSESSIRRGVGVNGAATPGATFVGGGTRIATSTTSTAVTGSNLYVMAAPDTEPPIDPPTPCPSSSQPTGPAMVGTTELYPFPSTSRMMKKHKIQFLVQPKRVTDFPLFPSEEMGEN